MNTYTHMNWLTLSEPIRDGSVAPLTAPVPRAVFTDYPEVLAAYDELDRLTETVARHEQAAAAAKAKAAESGPAYTAAVSAALAQGTDPAKVKNQTEKHERDHADQTEFAKIAKRAARAAGGHLLRTIRASAPDVYPAIESAMASEAERVRLALADLTDALADWTQQWTIRATLAPIALETNGGAPKYREGQRLTPDLTAALAVITTALDSNLDRLHYDESEVRKYRHENAAARAANAAEFGQSLAFSKGHTSA